MAPNPEQVIGIYGASIARIARAYERDPALREELVQEMLLAIVTALPRLRDPDKLKAYVFRIAHNRATRHVIRCSQEPRATGDVPELIDEAPSHELTMIANEREDRLLDAIHGLPLPYRQVITLLLEDLSYAEIGEAMGLSENNVGVRINRAKQILREALKYER